MARNRDGMIATFPAGGRGWLRRNGSVTPVPRGMLAAGIIQCRSYLPMPCASWLAPEPHGTCAP